MDRCIAPSARPRVRATRRRECGRGVGTRGLRAVGVCAQGCRGEASSTARRLHVPLLALPTSVVTRPGAERTSLGSAHAGRWRRARRGSIPRPRTSHLLFFRVSRSTCGVRRGGGCAGALAGGRSVSSTCMSESLHAHISCFFFFLSVCLADLIQAPAAHASERHGLRGARHAPAARRPGPAAAARPTSRGAMATRALRVWRCHARASATRFCAAVISQVSPFGAERGASDVFTHRGESAQGDFYAVACGIRFSGVRCRAAEFVVRGGGLNLRHFGLVSVRSCSVCVVWGEQDGVGAF